MSKNNLCIGGKDLPYNFRIEDGIPTISFGFNGCAKLQLFIPDLNGGQLDRLPLPEYFHTQDVFKAIYRQAALESQGKKIDGPCFPQFSLKIDHPKQPGAQAIWVHQI